MNITRGCKVAFALLAGDLHISLHDFDNINLTMLYGKRVKIPVNMNGSNQLHKFHLNKYTFLNGEFW